MILIHMTAAYSNAMLVAVLPHVSNFTKNLDLPVPQPITMSQVARFRPSPYKDSVACGLWLTNHYWFVFNNGFVSGFRSPTNWFAEQDIVGLERYVGKDNMTTNEAIQLARDAFHKLGYKAEDFHVDGPPTTFQGPHDNRILGHIPFCRIEWDSPESSIPSFVEFAFNIQFDVDMQRKEIVGMSLSSRRFFRPDPPIGVEPELETNYQAAGVIGNLARLNERIRERELHITPDYSNATLTATLPYVSDFARKLDLPVPQPLTARQVVFSEPPHYNTGFQETLELTNHYWFYFAGGHVWRFGSPDNWFEEKGTRTNWLRYGKDCLTTNEAIEFARSSFRKLGYEPEDFHLSGPPSSFESALDGKNTQYAYCELEWDVPDESEAYGKKEVEFDIDMQRKEVVGIFLSSTNFWRPDPKINVVPELESDYQERVHENSFLTNTPPHYSPSVQTNSAPP